jgi:hypothetical protein
MQTIGLVHSSGAAGMHDGAFGVAATIMADTRGDMPSGSARRAESYSCRRRHRVFGVGSTCASSAARFKATMGLMPGRRRMIVSGCCRAG